MGQCYAAGTYPFQSAGSFTIENYVNAERYNPVPLKIQVDSRLVYKNNQNYSRFHYAFLRTDGSTLAYFDVDYPFTTNPLTPSKPEVINVNGNISVEPLVDGINVRFGKQNYCDVAPSLCCIDFCQDDLYGFNIFRNIQNSYRIQLYITRLERFLTNGDERGVNKVLGNIIVPRVNILSQTLIDASDIGNTIFTIEDDVYYYDSTTPIIPDHKCQVYTTDKITKFGKNIFPQNGNTKTSLCITIFEQCCPKIVSVLVGNGNTAEEKIETIFRQINNDPNRSIRSFGESIITYAMLRYILSRILYGDFNINYLLNKYYQQFLFDLGNSRFCNFVSFFTMRTEYLTYFL